MDQTQDISPKLSVPERILRLRERMGAEKPSQESPACQADSLAPDEDMKQDKLSASRESDEMQYEVWDEQFLVDRWREWTQWEQWTQWSSH